MSTHIFIIVLGCSDFCHDSFTKLDTFLKSAIDEAMASAAATQNKKTGNKPTTEGKKRKAVRGSHGVETLKKANVNGMAMLSTFFKKADKV
jgi:ribonuclease H2 subunit B